jgi:hypothetical protein
MIKFNAKIDIDENEIAGRINNAINKAQFALDTQVIKDSNYYAPEDTGELMRSALRASQIGKGQVIWDTPYARRLYYNPQYNFSKDKNPNAQGLWFEKAKSVHQRDWANVVQKAVDENL